MKQGKNTTVAKYLLKRLHEIGLKHIFGVPGDYSLDFMDRIIESPIKYVGTCNELNAGYAADAYARLNGIGAAIVTYGVGGFSLTNAVVGAYAEQVPLVIISGAPGTFQRKSHALVHHLTKDYNLQYDVFKKITVDAVMLNNPHSAPIMIDRVLRSCVINKRPVYIEIPVDIVSAECPEAGLFEICEARTSDPESLRESVADALEIINSAKNPVILAGVELNRFKLADKVLTLIEKGELPFATTLSSKSALPELHPQFIGIYQGLFSRDYVRAQIENSDAVLALGVWMTDMNTGGFTAKLRDENMICVNSEYLRIRHHFYQNVWLGDFISELTRSIKAGNYLCSHPASPYLPLGDFNPENEKPMTVKRFYDRLNRFIDDSMIVIPETGDAICAAPELYIQEAENFMCQAYYLSIGFCLPGCLGASLARPDKRALLIIGDGAFQMTVQELSTIMRYGCKPIIFLLNNKGYTIERMIHEGPYNDINNWDYSKLPGLFGKGSISMEVKTEGDLEDALEAASADKDNMIFVEVHLDPLDCSEMLETIGKCFRKMSIKNKG